MINRLNEKRIIRFIKWLTEQGAEMLPTTNEYEVIRFRCADGVGIIYRNGKGEKSVSGPLVTTALNACFHGKKWSGKANATRRYYDSKRKKQLFKRDGDDCFYCDRPLGDDVTEEHLLALNQGGPNRLENMVLAHRRCNMEAGSLSIMEKVQLRDRIRSNYNGDGDE